jgi:serine/threonine protein kinase
MLSFFTTHTEAYFFKLRLNSILDQFKVTKTVPEALKNKISSENYGAILNYLMSYQITTLPVRLDKASTQLARTLNITECPLSGEIVATLETKSKNAVNEKLKNFFGFSGSFKNGKEAHRLDTLNAHPTLNLVYYHMGDQNTQTAIENENSIPILLYKKANELGCPHNKIPFQITVLGSTVQKDTIRLKKRYTHRTSFYTELAPLGHLSSQLKQNPSLTLAIRLDLVYQLLLALDIMQQANVIHQDLKPTNILVYSDVYDIWTLKITDFGSSISPSTVSGEFKKAISTYHFESPEISENYYDKDSSLYPYFHNMPTDSYAKQLRDRFRFNEHVNCNIPDHKNDVWAMGMIIYNIIFQACPNYNEETIRNIELYPFLQAMLQPERAYRCTGNQALALFNWQFPIPLKQVENEIKTLTWDFQKHWQSGNLCEASTSSAEPSAANPPPRPSLF